MENQNTHNLIFISSPFSFFHFGQNLAKKNFFQHFTLPLTYSHSSAVLYKDHLDGIGTDFWFRRNPKMSLPHSLCRVTLVQNRMKLHNLYKNTVQNTKLLFDVTFCTEDYVLHFKISFQQFYAVQSALLRVNTEKILSRNF